MVSQLSKEASRFLVASEWALPIVLKGLAILWVINSVNWVLGSPLHRLGLVPRRLSGLPGIVVSPLLHSGFNHLFFNSIPLFALSLFVLGQGVSVFLWVTGLIVLIEGIAVWLVGRYANHIGASGLISGYFGYVLSQAYVSPTFTTLLLAGIALYYFGGILLSLLPSEEKISWESHLLGFLSGITVSFCWMEIQYSALEILSKIG